MTLAKLSQAAWPLQSESTKGGVHRTSGRLVRTSRDASVHRRELAGGPGRGALQRLRMRRSGPRPAGPTRIVARRRKSLVFFDSDEVWAFEAAERLTRVHTVHGVFDIDLSLSAIESSVGRALARVHRNWLVNVAHIKELERDGETRVWGGDGRAADGRGLYVPVARDRAQPLRDMLVASAQGLRRGT